MISVKEAQEKARFLDIKDEGVWEGVLGLHESATKLFVAVMRQRNGKCGQEELNRRLTNALIGVMHLANKLNVQNLEEEYLKRIHEVKESN